MGFSVHAKLQISRQSSAEFAVRQSDMIQSARLLIDSLGRSIQTVLHAAAKDNHLIQG